MSLQKYSRKEDMKESLLIFSQSNVMVNFHTFNRDHYHFLLSILGAFRSSIIFLEVLPRMFVISQLSRTKR